MSTSRSFQSSDSHTSSSVPTASKSTISGDISPSGTHTLPVSVTSTSPSSSHSGQSLPLSVRSTDTSSTFPSQPSSATPVLHSSSSQSMGSLSLPLSGVGVISSQSKSSSQLSSRTSIVHSPSSQSVESVSLLSSLSNRVPDMPASNPVSSSSIHSSSSVRPTSSVHSTPPPQSTVRSGFGTSVSGSKSSSSSLHSIINPILPLSSGTSVHATSTPQFSSSSLTTNRILPISTSTITDAPSTTLTSPVFLTVTNSSNGKTSLTLPPVVTSLATSNSGGIFVTVTYVQANPTGIYGVSDNFSPPSSGFFANRAAVAGTFVSVGIVLALLCAGVTFFLRRRRRRGSSSNHDPVSSPRLPYDRFDDPETLRMSMAQSVNSTGPVLPWDNTRSSVADDHATRYPNFASSSAHQDITESGIWAGGVSHNNQLTNPFADYHVLHRSEALGVSNGPVLDTSQLNTRPVFASRKHLSSTPSSPSIYPTSEIYSPRDRSSVISDISTMRLSPIDEQLFGAGLHSSELKTQLVNNIDAIPLTPSSMTTTSFGSRHSEVTNRDLFPPLPAKSPLRTALSQRTLLNVHEKHDQ